jgi:cell division septal protein FtsQ
MSAGASHLPERTVTVERTGPRRGFFRRRNNRRIVVSRPSIAVWLADHLRALALKLVLVGKVLAVVVFLAGAALGGRQAVRHVIASPRFAVRDIRVGPTTHVAADELRALAGIRIGDRLLAVDPDVVAARVTTHPWVVSARVRRELPSALTIEVTERRAVASALLGALYLLDDAGHPFKRATFEEADGLPVLTGITRDQYAAMRPTSEAAFREALGVLAAYQAGDGDSAETTGPGRSEGSGGSARPKLSEIHVDPRAGFTAVLLDGGGEIRLGRGDLEAKLTALDRILAALGPRGPAALATVYLDGAPSERVTIRLKPSAAPASPAPPPLVASKKFRVADKRGED